MFYGQKLTNLQTHMLQNHKLLMFVAQIMDYNLYEPCSFRGVCLEVWVTDENDEIVHEEKRSKLYLLKLSIGSCRL